MNGIVTPRWIGRISYEEGMALQESLVHVKTSGSGENHLLLLEHDPVYTMGRMKNETSLGDVNNLPHPVQRTNRGGQATYHGPGQLVGYPVLDLQLFGKDLHAYLRFLEEVLIRLSAEHGVMADRQEGKTGVWVGNRKIASLGVGVRRWISMHGFAINICGDLSPFQHITPCGLPGAKMTSLEAEGATGISVESCARGVAQIFNDLLKGISLRGTETRRNGVNKL
ncbi:MAG: lipoyl(octanoyl) transferase LipB [Verrucomicrobia bacterium]|nr:MAG: lipoyl(octanoyl) transferase LipB [Verrucomicrobiota bacterium]